MVEALIHFSWITDFTWRPYRWNKEGCNGEFFTSLCNVNDNEDLVNNMLTLLSLSQQNTVDCYH